MAFFRFFSVTILSIGLYGSACSMQGMMSLYYALKGSDAEGRTPLHLAAQEGKVDEIAQILKGRRCSFGRKIDINALTNSCETAMRIAAKQGHVDMVKLLIAKGAQIGWGEMRAAVESGNKAVVEILLKNGGKAEDGLCAAGDNADMLALFIAFGVSIDRALATVLLLESNRNDTGLASEDGEFSKTTGHIIKRLLSDGANARSPSKDLGNESPFLFACQSGLLNVVQLMIAHDPSLKDLIESGLTAAVKKDGLSVISYLLTVYQGDYKNCFVALLRPRYETILDEALIESVKLRRHRCLRKLLDAYPAACKVEKEMLCRRELLPIACSNNYCDVISMLLLEQPKIMDACAVASHHKLLLLNYTLENRAACSVIPIHESSLHLAVLGGHKEAARILLTHGVDTNSKNSLGLSPLHYAAFVGAKEIAELLIAYGAHIDKKSELMEGLKESEKDLLSCPDVLVNHLDAHAQIIGMIIVQEATDGVNELSSSRRKGITPLHCAAYKGELALLDFLLQNGAHVNEPTDNGWTALDFAEHNCQRDTAALLREHGAKGIGVIKRNVKRFERLIRKYPKTAMLFATAGATVFCKCTNMNVAYPLSWGMIGILHLEGNYKTKHEWITRCGITACTIPAFNYFGEFLGQETGRGASFAHFLLILIHAMTVVPRD